MTSRRRSGRHGKALLPHRNRRGLALIVVLGVALVSAAVAAGGYRSVRDHRLKGFEERSRHDAKLFLALLVPSLPAAGIPDLVAVYNRESQSEAAARIGGEVVSSPSGLSLAQVPRDVRAAVEAGRTSQAQMTISGARYLVIGGQPARPDTQVYFFYPQEELVGGLAAMRPVFVAGWLAVVLLAVALTHLVAQQRIRALSLAHERERRFTADVAHELRTPLGGMVTAASLLQEQLRALPDGARRPAEVLITETRRLRQLVDDLMELARLEAGGHRLRVERLSLASAVSAVVQARGWQTQVTLDMDDHVVVAADRASLARIVLNLLGNALQHGGDRVKVSVWRDRDTAVLEVADTGPGIAPTDLPYVFERFYKADPARSGSGSGLGLAIAREHADLLGGTLEVWSVLGSGARFTLRLRAAEPFPSGDERPVGAASPGG
ncbi:MAG: HAMP domain-containing histidine kinase [Actinomycetota bacterium]|nr:HAMP domain-containing histidine kinase [Actinomycetota bacterium]